MLADSHNLTPGHLDPLGFWGLIVGTLGLVAAIGFGIWAVQQRQRKTLDWQPRYLASVLASTRGSRAKLQMTWDGQPVQNPFICQMTVQNTGTQPIISSDFVEPFRILFAEAQAYEVQVKQRSTVDVKLPVLTEPTSVLDLTLPPMNPGDEFLLEVIADGVAQYPVVSSKLIGQTRPTASVVQRNIALLRTFAWTAWIAAALTVLAIAISVIVAQNTHHANGYVPGYIIPLALLFSASMATGVYFSGKVTAKRLIRLGDQSRIDWRSGI